ncbi:MAG: lipoprotein-releasing ABC transporter ATP-binding protein LolD [Thiotrichales bacterium]
MSEAGAEVVLEAVGLQKIYHEDRLHVPVLHGVDMTVHAGEKVAVVGASGSGKSTLLHLLGGLDLPSKGEVTVCGQRISQLSDTARGRLRNRCLGFVYQFHHLLPEFTSLENVALPLLLAGKSIDEASERAASLLRRVGLGERLAHKPGEMSGGERQRTAIARALSNSPKIVMADEPTGNLDQRTSAGIYETMLEINVEMKTAFIIVTHDPVLAHRLDRIYQLEDGLLQRPG